MEKIIVVCLIENDKKELLLQKKTLDYPRFPGIWAFFGGKAESEDFHKEMLRELKEEIGMQLKINFIFTSSIQRGDKKIINHVFLAKLNDISKIRIGEGAGIAFFGRKELNKLNMLPDNKKILLKYFKEF